MGDRRPVGDVQPFAELYRSATTVVFKGYQQSLDRFVLLKRLRPEAGLDERIAQRFQDEARLIARVQHPNVVAIHAYGEDEISAYLIGEFIDGPDLQSLLERGALPVELAVFILREAARGLGAAHDRGIVHRDIKPGNILISYEGQVKVADFGMASFMVEDLEEFEGEVRGTVPYLAPEQVLGMAPSRATDLFSLGATFFEMLIGRRAFLGQSASDVFEAILHYDPIPSLAAQTNIPAEVVALCGKLLTRSPEDRYDSWREVELEASAFLDRLDRTIESGDLAAYISDPDAYEHAEVRPDTNESDSQESEEPADPPPEKSKRLWPPILASIAVLLSALTLWYVLGSPTSAPEGSDTWAGLKELTEDTRYPLVLYPFGDSLLEEALADLPDEPEMVRPRVLSSHGNEPVSGSGWLRIDVEPWAVVVANSDTLGRSPLPFPVLREPGTYDLLFLNPDFPSHQTQVEVRPGQTTDISVSLWDLVARVTLEVSPWAAVWVDGVARDTIPPQSRPFILAPGEHRVRLNHPALGEHRSTFRVEAGESRTLRYNLYELLSE